MRAVKTTDGRPTRAPRRCLMSAVQVGAILGIPAKRVRDAEYRAMVKLRRALAGLKP